MNDYFPEQMGIGARIGDEVQPVLEVIGTRFRAEHPPVPATYYLRSKQNFHISEDYLDEVKLHEAFPDMELETYACAWAVFTPPQAGPFHFRFGAYGPVRIYVNGELAYRTSHVEERFPDHLSDVCLNLSEGRNSLFFECICTPLGCGFRIGSSSYKGRRIQFFGPTKEREHMSGFCYSGPFQSRTKKIPEAGICETMTGMTWYPQIEWKEEEKNLSLTERLYHFRKEDGRNLLSVTAISCVTPGTFCLYGQISGKTTGYVDGRKVFELSDPCCREEKSGIPETYGETLLAELELSGGFHTLAFLGQEVSVTVKDRKGAVLDLVCPVKMAGSRPPVWMYLGPFQPDLPPDLERALTFEKPVETAEGLSFWRADLPDFWFRPFNEGTLYGEWNYPLGVVLYGMIESARILRDSGMTAYVKGHMKKCAAFYEYCMWDKSTYGAAPFHNQLTTMDSLDDCGSFASALLEVMKDQRIPEGRKLADLTAAYISQKQKRLSDGTFYRDDSYLPVMNKTMWADDMYMSIPFLCRYYELTGDLSYLQEAAEQVRHFFQYLYMPDLQIFSHIYDTYHQVQTKVPWGRGNGWALISLTELLTVMPDNYEERETILEIYRNLCQGCLRVQGEEGMWHQVLTMPDSYQETSCTAMFVCGFARGVRNGWLEEREAYAAAAEKGWKALCRTAIDWKGNLYGVCRGSGYSFSKEYYARDLGWNINDTHGTGIVLLAGIELERMRISERVEREEKKENGPKV